MIEFFLKWKDKYIDFDGVYGPQCVDVIKQYFKDVLGLKPHIGNAIDYWTNPPEGFEKIPKTLFNRPNPGDIIIWGTTYNPNYGHIAICNWSRFFDLGVFEQNNPVGSPCHYGEHKYNGILGWLRPKPTIKIAIVNGSDSFVLRIKEYLGANIVTKIYPENITEILLDDVPALINKLGINEKFVFIFFSGYNAYASTSINTATKQAFCIIPKGNPDTVPVHEFLHMMRKHINIRHIKPFIEDVERYPTSWSDLANFDNVGWAFQEQYNQLKTYLTKL